MPPYAQHSLRIREFTTSHWGRAFTALSLCVFVVWSGTTRKLHLVGLTPEKHVANESSVDAALQKATVAALGRREGKIIVMDPQTGRVRAVVNPEIAFAISYSPGSTIKPFVALAAFARK